jgi:hypothetical protein
MNNMDNLKEMQIRTCETMIMSSQTSIKIIMNTKSLSEEEKKQRIADEEMKIKTNKDKLSQLKSV